MGDAVVDELDALRAVYEDDCSIAHGPPLSVTYRAVPRCDGDQQYFVAATMTTTLGPDYPTTVPNLKLSDCKGKCRSSRLAKAIPPDTA